MTVARVIDGAILKIRPVVSLNTVPFLSRREILPWLEYTRALAPGGDALRPEDYSGEKESCNHYEYKTCHHQIILSVASNNTSNMKTNA